MHAHGLRDQTPDFGKDWALRIRLEKDLIALHSAHKQTQVRQVFEFPLKSAMPRANFPDKLAQIEGLINMTVKQG